MSFLIRNIQLQHDYPSLARLFRDLQPDAVSAEELEEQDCHIPERSSLSFDSRALAGFGRMESLDGFTEYVKKAYLEYAYEVLPSHVYVPIKKRLFNLMIAFATATGSSSM